MSQSNPLIKINSVSKNFAALKALTSVSLEVYQHEVVALVGDNAAGKSTLARVISGVYHPDSGWIEFKGKQVDIASPQIAHRMGISTVFQELALCDNLDVASNIFLGREIRKPNGLMDKHQMLLLAKKYLDQLNSRIPDPHTPLSELSAGQRQCVSIARALVSNPKLIVLDEPTASLSVAQTADVLTHIESLRSLGLGVIFISHNLTDVQAVSDRIEILRHGRNNGSFCTQEATYEQIIAAVTGAVKHPSYFK